MATFRDRFLPMTWKKDLANEIWQETMTPGAIFIDWIETLCGRNGLLAGYPEFITDNVFLSNLHGRISKPLQDSICNIPEIHECNDLDAWTKLVTVQDDKLHRKHKELEDVVEVTMARNKRAHLANTNTSTTRHSHTSIYVDDYPFCINTRLLFLPSMSHICGSPGHYSIEQPVSLQVPGLSQK